MEHEHDATDGRGPALLVAVAAAVLAMAVWAGVSFGAGTSGTTAGDGGSPATQLVQQDEGDDAPAEPRPDDCPEHRGGRGEDGDGGGASTPQV